MELSEGNSTLFPPPWSSVPSVVNHHFFVGTG